jgi:hypothetical protein
MDRCACRDGYGRGIDASACGFRERPLGNLHDRAGRARNGCSRRGDGRSPRRQRLRGRAIADNEVARLLPAADDNATRSELGRDVIVDAGREYGVSENIARHDSPLVQCDDVGSRRVRAHDASAGNRVDRADDAGGQRNCGVSAARTVLPGVADALNRNVAGAADVEAGMQFRTVLSDFVTATARS